MSWHRCDVHICTFDADHRLTQPKCYGSLCCCWSAMVDFVVCARLSELMCLMHIHVTTCIERRISILLTIFDWSLCGCISISRQRWCSFALHFYFTNSFQTVSFNHDWRRHTRPQFSFIVTMHCVPEMFIHITLKLVISFKIINCWSSSSGTVDHLLREHSP